MAFSGYIEKNKTKQDKTMASIYSANSSSVTYQKWSNWDYQGLILILVSISFSRSILPEKTKVAVSCSHLQLTSFSLLTSRLRTKSERLWNYFQPLHHFILKLCRTLWVPLGYKSLSMSLVSCLQQKKKSALVSQAFPEFQRADSNS